MILDEKTYGLNGVPASASVLDEETWDAIRAGELLDTGKITLVHFYDPKTDKYIAKPPHIKVGQTVGLYALGDNLSGVPQVMKIRVELYDPDEIRLDYDERELEIDYPGTIGSHYVESTATKEGKYTGKVELWFGGILVDSWEGLVATTEKFPWLWLGIGAGALGLILLAKPKKKKS